MVKIDSLKSLLPSVNFQTAKAFYWSPATSTVHYIEDELQTENGVWAFLHELAHAQLYHRNYESDLELLMLEVAAWQTAVRLGQAVNITIDPNHIEDCLDTYRDWLHQRSTCPACGIVSLQETPTLYKCFNCLSQWQVSTSRFCRPYRLSKYPIKNETSLEPDPAQATFH